MDANPLVDAFNELLPYFEAMDTRSAAILEYLKDKQHLTDEQFAPYLERAANGTNVKWLAARKRMEYLLASFGKEAAKPEERKTEKTADSNEEKTDAKKDVEKKPEESGLEMKPPATERHAETKGDDSSDREEKEGDPKKGAPKKDQ